MKSGDLLSDLPIEDLQGFELEELLLTHFGRFQATGPLTGEYLWRENEKLALSIEFGRDRSVKRLTPSEHMSATQIEELATYIRESLTETAEHVIRRQIMFTALPVTGYYRFDDSFQIMPVPSEAPRPVELIAPHPFVLEIKCPSSANWSLATDRQETRVRELELVLNALANVPIERHTTTLRKEWVLDHSDPTASSSLSQVGYHFPGFQGQVGSFSDPSAHTLIQEEEPNAYYGRLGISTDMAFDLPSNFAQQLNTLTLLSDDDRASFLRACYWFQHATIVWPLSRSAAVIALVSAIEALLEPTSSETCSSCGARIGAGPTQKFTEFVDRFAPSPSTTPQARRRFYSLRSAITHGDKLLHRDESAWGMSFRDMHEDGDLRELSQIVRVTLVNWLSGRNTTP